MWEYPQLPEVVAYLKKHGKTIGKEADTNEHARDIMKYYSMFHRSPDPVSYMLLVKAIHEWDNQTNFS